MHFVVYNRTNIAIYDRFIDTNIPLNEFLFFISKRVKYMPIKGGQIQNRYTRIFIISDMNPEYIYEKDTHKRWLNMIISYNTDEINEEDDIKNLFDF